MPEYSITFAKSARKELEQLPTATADRIFFKIESLALVPHPVGCQKLQGGNSLWRIRVGAYRVLYEIDDHHAVVDISAIGHRREVYRS